MLFRSVKVLASSIDSAALVLLRKVASSDPSAEVRAAAVEQFVATDTSIETLNVLVGLVAGADVHVAANAVDRLAARVPGAQTKVSELVSVYNNSPSAWLRSKLFSLLQRVDPAGAVARQNAAMSASSPDLLKAVALRVVALRNPATHMQDILDAAGSDNIALRAAGLLAIADDVPAEVLDVAKAKVVVRAALASGVRDRVYYGFWCVDDRNWTDLVPDLVTALKAAKPHETEVAQYGIRLLGQFGLASELPWIDARIEDDLPWIGRSAAAAHKVLTQEDVSARVRKELRVSEPSPTAEQLTEALAGSIEFETTRGVSRMRLAEVNPLAAAKYVATVKAGALNGVRMHRDVPAFVAQFGDPSFTGRGSSPMLTRTYRTSRFDMEAGTMAIARAFVDDDSSQLFYNRVWNVRLTQGYTPLGVITAGREAMDALEYGDTFVKVRFLPAP